MGIHQTAIIEDGASIAVNAEIGPYCIVGKNVQISENVKLHSHVVISGDTEIGEGTEIFSFSSLGSEPQDLKFKGEKTRLIIGRNNKIREHVTMNPGTEGGGGLTQVGDNCLFMIATHVAHDCRIGNNVILANNATLGGHVQVGDFAVIGGLSAVHQFVRIGAHAMIGGMSGVENDVIPYGSVMGERAKLAGLNLIGLKRRNFDKEAVNELRAAFKSIFDNREEGNFKDRVSGVKSTQKSEIVKDLVEFIESDSSRALCLK